MAWLDPDFDNLTALQGLMQPYPADKMQAAPVELASRRPKASQPSLFDARSEVPSAPEDSQEHREILYYLSSHMRCGYVETTAGALVYCGVQEPDREAFPTRDGWRCDEHGQRDSGLLIDDAHRAT